MLVRGPVGTSVMRGHPQRRTVGCRARPREVLRTDDMVMCELCAVRGSDMSSLILL